MERGGRPARFPVVATVVIAQVLLFAIFGKPQLGDGYLEAQWALDYAGGFVRRGMFGAALSAIVPAKLFSSLAHVAFYGVALTGLVVSCWTYSKLVTRAEAVSTRYGVVNILTWCLVAVNPYFWSFYAESLGRFDGIFFLVAAGTIAGLRRAPRTAAWALVLTAPFLGAVHEIYLILYFPLLLTLVGSSGLPKRLARRFLMGGAVVAVSTLGLFYALPKWTHLDVSLAQTAIHDKLGDMPRLDSALYNSQQKVTRAPLLHGSPTNAAMYAVEFTATTLFFCIGAFLTAGPLPRSLFSRPWTTSRTTVVILGCASYVALCAIAIDWGRFFMDLMMLTLLLLHARHSGSPQLQPAPGEFAFDVFRSRVLYLAIAAVVFAGSTNLPLTKIPIWP